MGVRGEVHDGVDELAEEEVEDEVAAEARSPRTKRKLGEARAGARLLRLAQ